MYNQSEHTNSNKILGLWGITLTIIFIVFTFIGCDFPDTKRQLEIYNFEKDCANISKYLGARSSRLKTAKVSGRLECIIILSTYFTHGVEAVGEKMILRESQVKTIKYFINVLEEKKNDK